MKIPRSRLEQLVREELTNHIKSLSEDDGEDIVDADKDSKDKGEKDGKKSPGKPPEKKPEPKKSPKKQPDAEDPADDELENDDEEEPDADAESDESLSDELEGKSVQSITHEPKSKLVPGAEEIVIQFNEIPDPLRIIITSTGAVKFFFKSLRNEL